jgi:hypothetical protein
MSKSKSLKIIPQIVKKGKIETNNKTEKKNFKITTILIITFLILLLLLCGYSFAKEIQEIIINGNTEIAEPILIIENNPSIDITATQNYGKYCFTVKNYNEEKITDVDLKYYIEILSNTDETVNFKLYENEKEIQILNNKTDFIEISKNSKEEREYRIEIEYDKEKSLSMVDIIQEIQVKVHTEQVKG